jgi:hypothetical protein
MSGPLRAARILTLGAALAGAPLAASGCAGNESLALVAGARVDPTTIDRDPIALLPSGVIALATLDATAMFRSRWGPEVADLVQRLLPLGPESNFVARRDVARIYGGVYAMQGADFCAVIQGNFDAAAIRRAADARAVTVLGAPLVKSQYAGNDLYTSANIGFVVVTDHTVIAGNETGMRRALDRIRVGPLQRSVPAWMADLSASKNATLTLAADVGAEPTVQGAAGMLGFLGGLRQVRVLGNFEPPGFNLAGSLTYGDPQAVARADEALKKLQSVVQLASLFTSFAGISIPDVHTAAQANDLAFTVALDDGMLRGLFHAAEGAVKRAPAPAPTPRPTP